MCSHAQPHIIQYSRIAHLNNPVLSIKVHYPGPASEEDVVVEFRQASQN